MYAEGDGVKEDDYEAYKMFEQVIREGADQGTQNESYVADALVALAGYVKRGIPIRPSIPIRARRAIFICRRHRISATPMRSSNLARC